MVLRLHKVRNGKNLTVQCRSPTHLPILGLRFFFIQRPSAVIAKEHVRICEKITLPILRDLSIGRCANKNDWNTHPLHVEIPQKWALRTSQ
jgi:hypothetical protein